MWTTMQNLEVLAWKLNEWWRIAQMVQLCLWVSESVSDNPRYRDAFAAKTVLFTIQFQLNFIPMPTIGIETFRFYVYLFTIYKQF